MKHIKRLLLVLLGACIAFSLFLLTAVSVSAENQSAVEGSYTVRSIDGGYSLTQNGGEPSEWTSLNAAISQIPSGAVIILSDIESDEVLEFSDGEYLVSGNLRAPEIKIHQGASVTLLSSEVLLDGGIEVRGGSLTVDGSSVVSGECAVKLTYTASSTLVLKSGQIVGGERGPAILISRGGAYIKGGRVYCPTGVAVENHASPAAVDVAALQSKLLAAGAVLTMEQVNTIPVNPD